FEIEFNPNETSWREVKIELWEGEDIILADATVPQSASSGQVIGIIDFDMIFNSQQVDAGLLAQLIQLTQSQTSSSQNQRSTLALKVILDDQEGQTTQQLNFSSGKATLMEQFEIDFNPNETSWREMKIELWDGQDIIIASTDIPLIEFMNIQQIRSFNLIGIEQTSYQGKIIGTVDIDMILKPDAGELNSDYDLTQQTVSSRQPQLGIQQGDIKQQENEQLSDLKSGIIDITVVSIRDMKIALINPENNVIKVVLDDQEGVTQQQLNFINGISKIGEQFEIEFNPNETSWREVKIELWEGEDIILADATVPLKEYLNKRMQKSCELIGSQDTLNEGNKIGIVDIDIIFKCELMNDQKNQEQQSQEGQILDTSPNNLQNQQQQEETNISPQNVSKERQFEGQQQQQPDLDRIDDLQNGIADVTILTLRDLLVSGVDIKNLMVKVVLDDQEGVTQQQSNFINGIATFGEQFEIEFNPNETSWREVKIELWEGEDIILADATVPVQR
ncbi:MAG: hypothetical protein EZS28_034746, partial [Streblomastix strix]